MSPVTLRALARHWARKYRNASPGTRTALAAVLVDLATDADHESAAYADGCADVLTLDDAHRGRRLDWIH